MSIRRRGAWRSDASSRRDGATGNKSPSLYRNAAEARQIIWLTRPGSDRIIGKSAGEAMRKNAPSARHGIARINDSAARPTPRDVQIRRSELSDDRKYRIDCAATALMPLDVLALNGP